MSRIYLLASALADAWAATPILQSQGDAIMGQTDHLTAARKGLVAEPITAVNTLDIRQAALYYAHRDWPVIRVWGVTLDTQGNLVCDCPLGAKCKEGNRGKHVDSTTGGLHSATTNIDTINDWWDRFPHSNVALRTGEPFGIVVDVDIDRDTKALKGQQALDLLEEMHGPFPLTLTAQTGSGAGRHYVLKDRPGYETGCSKKRDMPALDGAKGIDLKGEGGYIVAAPSLSISGGRYEWQNELEPAPAPEWLYVGAGLYLPTTAQSSSHRIRTIDEAKDRLSLGDLRGEVDPNATLTEITLRRIQEGDLDANQSDFTQSICKGAASVRFSPRELYRLLKDPKNGGGEGLRSRIEMNGDRGGETWFVRGWKKAQDELDWNVSAIELLKEEAEATAWENLSFVDANGKPQNIRKKSLEKVLLASLDVAIDQRTTTPKLGKVNRMRAKTGGLEQGTIRKALQALEHLGWLYELEPHPHDATIYQLDLDTESRTRTWELTFGERRARRNGYASADAMREGDALRAASSTLRNFD